MISVESLFWTQGDRDGSLMISVESLIWTLGDRGRIAHDFGGELVLDAGRPGTDRS